MKGGSRSYFDHNKFVSKLYKLLKQYNLDKIINQKLKNKLQIFVNYLDKINVITSSKSNISNIDKRNLDALYDHYKEEFEMLDKIN